MFKQTFENQEKTWSSVWEQFPPPQVSSFDTHLTGADSDTRGGFYPPPSQLHYPSALPLHCWLTVRGRCARVPYRGRERWLGYPSAPPSNFQPPEDNRGARVTNFDQFCREVSSGSTGGRIPVPSVCEGSRLAGLGDVRGFIEKFQVFISLIEFFAASFHCFRGKSPRFLQKLSFGKIWLKNQNPPISKRFLGFVHLF